MIDVVFYGVAAGSDAGHFFYAPSAQGRVFVIHGKELPLPSELARAWHIDARWCFVEPNRNKGADSVLRSMERGRAEEQGRGYIHSAHGWTIISWWDRSGDRRAGSNAVFLVRGYHQWASAMKRARAAFPREVARMEAAYPIRLAGADLPDPGEDPAAAFEVIVCREVERFRALPPDIQAAVRERSVGWATAEIAQPAKKE